MYIISFVLDVFPDKSTAIAQNDNLFYHKSKEDSICFAIIL